MKSIILPGFSLQNKEWADSIKKSINPISPITVIYWNHWKTGNPQPGWIEKEAQRIIKNISSEKINILAKSIGTAVAMVILKLRPSLVNKIILCGVPINDFLSGDEKYYQELRDFPFQNILCIQNKDDHHGNFLQVRKFLHSINPNIKMVEKPRSDHEYPYSKDFIKFLI